MPRLNSELRIRHSNFINVDIGSFFACSDGSVLRTLLGSCVSACLYDPLSGVAGMNHILLSEVADMKRFDANARYGIHAMEILINEMVKLGAARSRIKAKAFGGSNVLRALAETMSPGEKNIKFLLEYLEMERIPLMAKDLGGDMTRVIFFHTDTFEVFVRKTSTSQTKQAISKETARKTQVVEEKDQAGDIELFD
ncbi:MAG: chemotaxis protein CheD [Candidatus Riflebacteria bacterium]